MAERKPKAAQAAKSVKQAKTATSRTVAKPTKRAAGKKAAAPAVAEPVATPRAPKPRTATPVASPRAPKTTLPKPPPHGEPDMISVRGAREHNLRNVDIDLPRDQLVVMHAIEREPRVRTREN